MKKRVTYFMVALLVIFTVAAPAVFGGGGAEEAVEEENILSFALGSGLDQFDPPFAFGFYNQVFATAVFEPLIWDFDGRTGERGLRGILATDWEALDDYTWRFWLREGVTFHNGEPFNAEAVKFSIERAQSDELGSTDKFVDYDIARIVIIDDYTIDIITGTPIPILPQALSRNGAFIVAPGHYSEITAEEAAVNPVGTGPYMLREYRVDEVAILDRFEDHWAWDEKSNIDQLHFKIIPERSTLLAELLTGNVDIAMVDAESLERIEANRGTSTIVAGSLQRAMMSINQNIYPQASDPRVRRAMNYAIDREALVNAFAFGNMDFLNVNVVNPPNEHPDLEPFPYDLDKARDLMAEAGYPDGFTVERAEVFQPDAFDYGEAVVGMLAEIGIEVGEVVNPPMSVIRPLWADRALHFMVFPWTAAENTPQTDMFAVSDRRQTNNTHWYRQDWEDLYSELMVTVNPDKAREINLALQEILMEDPPWIYLYLVPLTYGVSDRTQGFSPHPSASAQDFRSIYFD